MIGKQQSGKAGTPQSGDVMVVIRRAPGLRIRIESPVLDFVKNSIEQIVASALQVAGISGASVQVYDNAAAEWVLRARIETAIRRLQKV